MAKIILPAGGDTNPDLNDNDQNNDTPNVEVIELDGASYNLDAEGNALNADGTIFKTKTELTVTPNVDKDKPTTDDTDDEPSELEIDGVIYTIDANGDAKNTDGTVFMTKAQIAEAQNTDDSAGSISEVIKRVNVIPVDENNKPIIYEDTIEGIASYIEDVRIITQEEDRQALREEFYAQNPDIYQVYLHKLNTGSIEGFGQRVDWSGVDVESADETVLTNLIVANEMRTGKTKEAAEYYAKLIKADGKLKEFGVTAKTELVADNAAYEARALSIQAQNEKDEADAEAEMWDKVITKAKSGVLTVGNTTYKLPQVFRIKTADGKITTANNTDFVNYIARPQTYIIEGQKINLTPNQYDKYMEDLKRKEDDEVFDALNRFVKYDKSQFIEEQIKAETKKRIILTSKSGSARGNKVEGTQPKTIKLPVR